LGALSWDYLLTQVIENPVWNHAFLPWCITFFTAILASDGVCGYQSKDIGSPIGQG